MNPFSHPEKTLEEIDKHNNKRDRKEMKIVLGVIVGAILLGIVTTSSWTIINPGERGIVSNLGATQNHILNEGFHFKIPLYQSVKKVSVRTEKEQVDGTAASNDLQIVTVSIVLNYHLDPGSVNKLWQEVGDKHAEKIVNPKIQETIKATIAKYTAEDLIKKRSLVKEEAKTILVESLAQKHIIVDELSIVNFDFSESFNAAIEAKVTAEQTALAAKNKLEETKFVAEGTLTTARAEAESIRIKTEAIQKQGGADYIKLKWIEAWAAGAKVPTFIGGGSNDFMLNLEGLK